MGEDVIIPVAAQTLHFAFIWELPLKTTGLSGSADYRNTSVSSAWLLPGTVSPGWFVGTA